MDSILEQVKRNIERARRLALTQIDLRLLSLSFLPDSIGDLAALRELDLSESKLESLPESFGGLTNLERLDLTDNPKLSSLPHSFGSLAKLQWLVLTGSKLRSVPRSFGGLTQLRQIKFSRNQLRSLPESFGRLARLQELDLSGNQLRSLPESFGHLSALQKLDLSRNQLRSLPESLGHLSALQKLDLSFNQLESLPESFGRLSRLQELDLSGNQLRSLPKSISELWELRELFLHRNDALGLPTEVLGPAPFRLANRDGRAQDPEYILRYYFRSRSESTRQLNEAKILIVGQADVGKTSLVKRLVYGTFEPNEPQTEGIIIAKWQVPGIGGEQIRLNVWDFGGQEIMHATHQFFLTKRSLYLIVLDARKGENESNLNYWLNIVQSYGGDAPIILVTNKCEPPHHLDLNENRLTKDYSPNLKGFAKVSCKTGEGIETLQTEIAEQIRSLPHVSDLLPESYFRVKDHLATQRKDFIDYREYKKLCCKKGVADEKHQQILIRFLHDLGDVLYFHDPQGPYHELRDTNILNPEWVTKGVYKILNNLELIHRHGVLDRERLGAILSDSRCYPPSRHDFIIGMMRKFELCFEFPDCNGQRLLIPELLHPNEPELGFDTKKALNLEYHYNVLPSGLISRFIVRMHHRLSPKPTYWRSGVVLEIDGNLSLVRADTQRGRIFVSVLGPKPSRPRALAAIRDAFAYIHSTIPKIGPEEKVPLPDKPGVVVSYSHLTKLEEQGEESIFPDGADHKYSVRELLQGIRTAPIFDVFLSHNSKDKPVVRRIGEQLKALGLRVWLDEWELAPGRAWQEALEEIIQTVGSAAVLIGPDGFGPWEVPEMRGCLSEFHRRKMPVIPVLLPGATKKPDLPMFLSHLTWVDLRRGLTKAGLDRLMWGITGQKPVP